MYCSVIFIAVKINSRRLIILVWNKTKQSETKRNRMDYIGSWHTDQCHEYWIWGWRMRMRISLICVATAYNLFRKKLFSCRNNSSTFVTKYIVWCVGNIYKLYCLKVATHSIVYGIPFDGRVIFAPSWHSNLIRHFFFILFRKIYWYHAVNVEEILQKKSSRFTRYFIFIESYHFLEIENSHFDYIIFFSFFLSLVRFTFFFRNNHWILKHDFSINILHSFEREKEKRPNQEKCQQILSKTYLSFHLFPL